MECDSRNNSGAIASARTYVTSGRPNSGTQDRSVNSGASQTGASAPSPSVLSGMAAGTTSSNTIAPRTSNAPSSRLDTAGSTERRSQQRDRIVCYRCQNPGHYAFECSVRSCNQIGAESGTSARAPNSTNAPKNILINGIPCTGRVDTEAEVSVLEAEVAERLNLQLSPSAVTAVTGVGNGWSVPLGQTLVSLEADGSEHERVPLTILPEGAIGSSDVLIGKDLLDRGLMSIYYRGSSWILKPEKFLRFAMDWTKNHEEDIANRTESEVRILAEADAVVPAKTIRFVEANIGHRRAEALLLNEFNNAGALCQVNQGKVLIPVANNDREDKRFRKGSVVARGSLVDPADIFAIEPGPRSEELAAVHQIRIPAAIEEKDVEVGITASQRVREELMRLLNEFSDVISTGIQDLGRTELTECIIEEMPGKGPVWSRPYRLSMAERDALKDIVKQMHDAGLVRESTSPYASPVMLVRKKDGSWRMVIDYRKLNEQTARRNFPIPLIDDILDAVGGKRLYSTLDLASGYFQIPMAPGSDRKAAFITPDGHYEPVVMMQGLANGPAVFQELMTKLQKVVGDTTVFPFIDDMICAADRYDEHLEQLRRILTILREARLKVQLKKCKFLQPTVEFLGFRISGDGVRPGKGNLRAIENYPRPIDTHDVRKFVGMASFFRRFIRGFASIVDPLIALMKKDAVFEWSEACETAFIELKKRLMAEPVLVKFTRGCPIQLHTDASGFGLGASLMQKIDDHWRMVYAVSRRLSSTEKKYHSTRLEQLAVVWACERFRHYLYGEHFQVITDCVAVQALRSKTATSGQIARWLNRLSEFKDIVHRAGSKMQHVDAFSRYPTEDAVTAPSESEPNDSTQAECGSKRVWSLRTFENSIAMIQEQDDDLKKKIERKRNQSWRFPEFEIKDEVLYRVVGNGDSRKLLFVAPRPMRKYLRVMTHERAGHFGTDKTLALLRERYWFSDMKKYVQQHIRVCIPCLYNKEVTGRQEGFCNSSLPPKRPFEKIVIDHVGPFPKSQGKEHIIVLVDSLTKYVVLEAVRSTSAKYVVDFLKEKVFLNYGVPQVIVSDRGSAYTSKEFAELMRTKGVRHCLTSTQRPQSNGTAERMVKTVVSVLRSLCNHPEKKEWASKVQLAAHHINRAPAKSTGRPPFEVLYGYLPPLEPFAQFVDERQERGSWRPPQSLREEVRTAILRAQEDYAAQYDKHRKPHVVRYSVGDIVVVKRLPVATGEPTKLQPKYRGPHVITSVLPNDTYQITQLVSHTSKAHVTTAHCSQLKLFKVANEDGDQIVPGTEDDEIEEGASITDSSGPFSAYRTVLVNQDSSDESRMDVDRESEDSPLKGDASDFRAKDTDEELAEFMENSFNVTGDGLPRGGLDDAFVVEKTPVASRERLRSPESPSALETYVSEEPENLEPEPRYPRRVRRPPVKYGS